MTDVLFAGQYTTGGGATGAWHATWDQAGGGAGGHPSGGKIVNANLLYADGHVVLHNSAQFIWSWYNPGQVENFY
jgi:prepilin-type processing-associated H-X9-DG protein